MFDITTHSPAIAPSDDWRETLSWGDIVSFRFPVEGAGRPPKKRPWLVLDIAKLGETRYAVLAYGTSADTSANRGYEVRLTETEARAAGLHRATRFVGARRMLVALDHCGFVICAAKGAPRIGRLTGDAFERLNAVRGRIHAEADMAADQRTRRRARRTRHRRAGQRPVTVEHRTPRRRMTASRPEPPSMHRRIRPGRPVRPGRSRCASNNLTKDDPMHIDTKTLLPRSIPTQNTHRLVAITAEAHPDEFARLEMTTADALATARAALAAYQADPIADPALQPVIRALDDLIGRGRVLGPTFHDLADEALRHLSRIDAHTMSDKLCAIQRPLGEALTLALRVSDLLAADREIGWHHGIGHDR